MEKLIANIQEEKNLASYESDTAYQNFHSVGLRDLEKNLIEKYFPLRTGKLLDIGCGYGRTTKPLADRGYHVVGIDVSPRMIETARREHPAIDFRLMSATDLEFKNESFDYALFSFNGIDYVYPEARRQKALAEIFRVLKPGGRLILTSHNRIAMLTHPRLSSVKTWWQTIRHGLLGSPYVLATYEGGDQVTFSRAPWRQVHDFKLAGFELLAVMGKRHTHPFTLNLLESWPYFVLQKPQ